jgi:hypothetical protein
MAGLLLTKDLVFLSWLAIINVTPHAKAQLGIVSTRTSPQVDSQPNLVSSWIISTATSLIRCSAGTLSGHCLLSGWVELQL